MFSKFFDKLAMKRLQKKRQKKMKKQKEQKDKQRQEVIKNLTQLKNFVGWLNDKGFTNRRERKQFWRDIVNGRRLAENVIEGIIQNYKEQGK